MGRTCRKEISTDLMATSYAMFKEEITDFLKFTFDKDATILDVGAGEGTYLPFLQDYFTNIEAVEIFEPNIIKYDLRNRYKKVYNVDIKDFKYEYYDIIIFGDVIEHLDVKDAQEVLKYALKRCKQLVVAVPYKSKQGIEEDNVYEIHKQDDLTDEIMRERYPYLINVYKSWKYGYYVKEVNMKNYVVKATRQFDDTQEKTEYGTNLHRNIGDVFNCTKERYEFLKQNNAVMLVGIDEIKEAKIVEEKPKVKKSKKKDDKVK